MNQKISKAKRILSAILVTVMLFSSLGLTGCQKADTQETDVQETDAQETDTSETYTWEEIEALQEQFEGSLVLSSTKDDEDDDEYSEDITLDSAMSASFQSNANFASQIAMAIGTQALIALGKNLFSRFEGAIENFRGEYDDIAGEPDSAILIYDKLDEIESSLHALANTVTIQDYRSRINQRNNDILALQEATFSSYKIVMENYYNLDNEDTKNSIKKIVNEWATTVVNGNSIYVEVTAIMKRLNSSADGMSYPQIFDLYAEKIYPFEHDGYEFRETQRVVDIMTIIPAYTMNELYYLFKAEDGDDVTRQMCLEKINEMKKCLLAYSEVLEANPVVHHDDVIICQIEGCEYVFDKALDHFDYSESIYNYRDKFHLRDSNVTKVVDQIIAGTKVYESYDCDSKTYANERKQLNKQYQYLTQKEYKAIYDFYQNRDKKGLYDILKNAGITGWTANTRLVASKEEQGYTLYTATWFTGTSHATYSIFKFYSKDSKKNSDWIDITSCMNDTAEYTNYKLCSGINISQASKKGIGNWKDNRNRTQEDFCSLRILCTRAEYLEKNSQEEPRDK